MTEDIPAKPLTREEVDELHEARHSFTSTYLYDEYIDVIRERLKVTIADHENHPPNDDGAYVCEICGKAGGILERIYPSKSATHNLVKRLAGADE